MTAERATCQHCDHPVEFARSARGFKEWIHVETQTADECPT